MTLATTVKQSCFKVLVPVVYLAQAGEALPGGALIGGGTRTQISAVDINNRGSILAREELSLLATYDLTNDSGRISAPDVTLIAGNDLHLGTATTRVTLAPGQDFTHEGVAGRIDAGQLTAIAGRDLTLAGSALKSGGNLRAAAGNNLTLGAAADEERIAYVARNKRVTDIRQSERSTARTSTLEAGKDLTLVASEGATVRAGQDIALTARSIVLDAAHERENSRVQYSHVGKRGQQQLQSQIERDTASGSIIDAGRHLSLESAGDTTLTGSALAAGQDATLKTGSDLKLLAAQSRSSADIHAYGRTSKKATTLTYSDQELRQLLSTVTVGQKLTVAVGGNFQADTDARGQFRLTVTKIAEDPRCAKRLSRSTQDRVPS